MYWVLDVTINILQTPHRALVADLATEEQQVPMQVVFVLFIAFGQFLAFCTYLIYPVPVEHMLELMLYICLLNTVSVLIQLSVVKEKPLIREAKAAGASLCAPVLNLVDAMRGSPFLLWHLAAVQCLVWTGITSWTIYGGQWFANSVHEGDQNAPAGSDKKIAYAEGMRAFGVGGQCKASLMLVSSLTIIAILLKTTLRPRLVYAPCIYIGAVASILAAFVVGHDSLSAIFCMTMSVMPETGSFAIPFGLVAVLNKRAEEEGMQVSTALQMALLNCCIAVGQLICTMALAALEERLPLAEALPCTFMISAAALLLAGTGALFLNDGLHSRPGDSERNP
jgi:hypothetical protein